MTADSQATAHSATRHVLTFDHVTKSYEAATVKTLSKARRHVPRTTVLHDISFTVGPGETVGLLGRNGAGKSTLLKLISGVTAPDSGKVLVSGRVGSLLEVGTGFHPELTGRENVYLNASILGMKVANVDRLLDEIVDFAELGHALDRPLKHYSSGMQVRLGFSVAAHLECDLLLMDEVLAVGDALFQARCMTKLHQLCSEEGRTALVVSHGMAPVARLCDRVMVLASGALVFDGPTADGIAHYTRSLQGSFTQSGSVVDLRSRTNTAGEELWIQSVESVEPIAASSQRTFVVRIALLRPTRERLVFGLAVSDNVGAGVTSGFVELPPVEPEQVGSTMVVSVSLPMDLIAPGVYFLDLGISAGLGSQVLDYVRRAVALNADSTPPEAWRERFGDARVAVPMDHSWHLER